MLRLRATVQPRRHAVHAIINWIAGTALIGTLLVAVAPACADDGNALMNVCRGQDRPEARVPTSDFDRGACIGYATAAYEAILLIQSAVWVEKQICVPNEGLTHGVTTEIFARYLVDHPAKRHLPGLLLMEEALKQAFPCKRG